MNIRIKLINKRAKVPTQATKFSAGCDIYSPERFTLMPGELIDIPLGFCIELPVGYYAEMMVRSSIGKKGVILSNGIGIVDWDYRGELHLLLCNIGNMMITIAEGDRVAQLIPHKYHNIEFEVVEELTPTDRGSGGLGSTGQ